MQWRAAERFGILPPGLKDITRWDQLTALQAADFMAYEQVRQYEDVSLLAATGGNKL